MVQYRKSKKIGPVRFTASTRGISTSVGSGPFRITRRADGRYQQTVRVPGTGIRDTRVIGGQRQRQPQAQPSILAALVKLVLLLLLLGFILSPLTDSLAVGYGIVGALAIAALVGIAGWLVVLALRRRRG